MMVLFCRRKERNGWRRRKERNKKIKRRRKRRIQSVREREKGLPFGQFAERKERAAFAAQGKKADSCPYSVSGKKQAGERGDRN